MSKESSTRPRTDADAQRRFFNAAYSPERARRQGSLIYQALQRLELHRTDAVLRFLPRGGQLLDVGCGDGAFLLRCAAFFDHVTGLDVADTQIQAAQISADLQGVSNATLLRVNVDHGLPLPDAQFDVLLPSQSWRWSWTRLGWSRNSTRCCHQEAS